MILALLLLALSSRVEILPQSTQAPPADWKSRRFSMRKPGVVDVSYQVIKGGPSVRLSLIRRQDEARVELGRSFHEFAAESAARQGRLHARLEHPGEYAILIDNRQDRVLGATVSFRGLILYDEARPDVRTVPPGRQVLVVATGFSVFFGLCWFAGRRLWPVLTGQRNQPPSPPYA